MSETYIVGSEKLPVQLTGNNVVQTRKELEPIAIPKTPLQYELKYFDSYPCPTSIGSDGAVYGRLGGAKTGKIFRNTDGFTGAIAGEEGYDFSVEQKPNAVIFVTKLDTKYIVVTSDKTTMTGAIWVSDSFTTGFTKVVSIAGGGYPDILGISWYHGSLSKEKVLLVGEYGQNGVSKRLHATFDGGRTWSVIKQTTVNDATQNSHWHSSIYDPYRGRVWASQGDGPNALLSYSDDLGATWKDVPVASNNYGIDKHQPTAMVAFSKKLFMAPDTNLINPSILSIPIDTSHTKLNSESFGLEWEHTVWDQEYCFLQYGQPPVMQKDSEAYMLFPNFNGKKKHFIVATGDGGATWHNVLTATGLDQFSNGIIGTDKLGFMYAYIVEGGNPKIIKMSRISWQYK